MKTCKHDDWRWRGYGKNRWWFCRDCCDYKPAPCEYDIGESNRAQSDRLSALEFPNSAAAKSYRQDQAWLLDREVTVAETMPPPAQDDSALYGDPECWS